MARSHTTKRGDTVAGIARLYQVTLKQVVDANPFLSSGGRTPDLIHPGEELVIPDSPTLPPTDTQACPLKEKVHWATLECLDEDGRPVAGEPVLACFTDGSTLAGELNDGGVCRFDGVAEGNVNYYVGEKPEEDVEGEIRRVREELKTALDQMVKEVADRAKYLEDELRSRGLIEQGWIYTGAFLNGMWENVSGTAEFAWSTIVALYDLNVETHQLIYRAIVSKDLSEIKVKMEALAGWGGESLDALQEAYDTLTLLSDDAESWEMLASFPERYFSSMHSTEYVEMGGGLSFEIILALLTAGTGTVASAVSKSRYLTKESPLFNMNCLGRLLICPI